MHIEIGDKLYICTLVNTFEKIGEFSDSRKPAKLLFR